MISASALSVSGEIRWAVRLRKIPKPPFELSLAPVKLADFEKIIPPDALTLTNINVNW